MESYIRQKRAAPGIVQASDLQISRPMSGAGGIGGVRNGGRREIHGYDGPLQFMSPNNPDQIFPISSPNTTTPIKCDCKYKLNS